MNRVDRFNARLAKTRKDEEVLGEKSLEASRELKNELEGSKELMEEGNIKQAAAVFSHEGLQVFSQLFSNSVEKAVSKSLKSTVDKFESSVEKIVERKLLSLLEGLTDGVKKFTECSDSPSRNMVMEGISDEVVESFNEHMTEVMNSTSDTVEETPVVPEPILDGVKKERPVVNTIDLDSDEETKEELLSPTQFTERRRFGVSKEAMGVLIPIVSNIVKSKGEVRLTEISNILDKHHNIELGNSTMSMDRIVKKVPSIVKIGHGLYKWEEKSFRDVINFGEQSD